MTLTLNLPADLTKQLESVPATKRNDFAVAALRVGSVLAARPLTATELLALPADVRGRILEAQATAMAPYYEADLALSPGERELTAFTALDGVDPILEQGEYTRHAG